MLNVDSSHAKFAKRVTLQELHASEFSSILYIILSIIGEEKSPGFARKLDDFLRL
jgi:hypothetical protein